MGDKELIFCTIIVILALLMFARCIVLKNKLRACEFVLHDLVEKKMEEVDFKVVSMKEFQLGEDLRAKDEEIDALKKEIESLKNEVEELTCQLKKRTS